MLREDPGACTFVVCAKISNESNTHTCEPLYDYYNYYNGRRGIQLIFLLLKSELNRMRMFLCPSIIYKGKEIN